MDHAIERRHRDEGGCREGTTRNGALRSDPGTTQRRRGDPIFAGTGDSNAARDRVSDQWLGLFDPAQTGGLESGWKARLTQFEMPPHVVPGSTALDRLELEVWWRSGSHIRTYTLDAYRPRVIKPEDVAEAGK